MRTIKVEHQPTTTTRSETQPVRKHGADLSQKAYLNAVAAVLDYGAQMAVALFVSPLLVNGLGSSTYGVLQILQRLTSYLSAADGRPTQALKWTVARYQNSDDIAEKRRAIGSAVGVWLVFLPLLVIAGAAVVWVAPTITKVSQTMYPAVRAAAALLVTDLILISLVLLPDSVIRGMNLGYKRMILTPAVTVIRGILTAGAIYLSFGLIGVTAAPLAASILAGVVYWGTVRRYIPWFGLAKPTFAEVRHFASFSGWFLAWRLVNKVLMSGDVVLLGIIASAELVTVYTLTGYAAQVVVGLIGIVMGAIVPGMGGLLGTQQYRRATDIRREMLILNWLLTAIIGIGILLWNKSFISLWVGQIHYAGPWATLLIVLSVTQLTFIRTDAFIIDLTLDLSRKVILGGISSLLSLGIAAVLIKPLGIVGLCIGLIAGRTLLTVLYPVLVKAALNDKSSYQLSRMIRPTLLMACSFGVACTVGQHIVVNGWLEFAGGAVVTGVVTAPTMFFLGLSRSQRRTLLGRFKQIRLFGNSESTD